ncbi:hypothetical protein K466DRAFT_657859 [Polyporus arcularius HHB13444]|uniref:F-box domain-containing protein n=1 Tax=Polyporus arcularius HHB13444 TaxID=1314778 RepID=A0A5C3PXM1_9APHY|nr:hypothetical protein K466DRAFT_657859 [Polyporus arcularius HHB13444]
MRFSVAGPTRSCTVNLEAMQIIMSYLPRVDLLSASYASRAVREMAIRELLSRPLVFEEVRPFQSWCEFVLAERSRLACVRDLSLLFEEEDWEEPELEQWEEFEAYEDEIILTHEELRRKRGKLLLEVLRRATRLQRLFIVWVQDILYANPAVPLVISYLPALKSFEVEPYSVAAQYSVTAILARMESRLKFLSLQYVTYDGHADGSEGVWDYDLPRALGLHLQHLEELHLGSPHGRTPEIRSTTLRTLKIPMGEEEPRPRELFEAFPNLRNLLLFYDQTSNDPFLPVRVDRYPVLRDSRISEQSGGHVWSSLDTVRGEIVRLYVFGLTCPVRRLEMQEYQESKHDAAVKLVRYASPQKLFIGTGLLGTECFKAMASKPSLLAAASPGRPHVTHLIITISCPVQTTLLDDLSPLLQNSNIEYLRLAMGGPDIHEDYFESNAVINAWPGVRECTLNLDLNLLRDTLVGTVKSLRMLAFTIVNHAETVWTVDRSGGSPMIAKVDAIIPRDLIRREEA